jgi:hypothetical protein
MITLHKIKIFDRYGGNIDGLLRVGRDQEKMLFDNNDWSMLASFYQDIVLIKSGLVAQAYFDKVVSDMKTHCDKESFDKLTRDFHSSFLG